MIFTNANIFTKDYLFERGSLSVQDGIFESVLNCENKSDEIIDCNGKYIIPGLVDIHIHGAVGHDFCDSNEDEISEICQYELSNGVTSLCATTMTYPEEKLQNCVQIISKSINNSSENIVGINMEGPFISKDKVGAQNPEYVQKPSLEMFERLQKASDGLIKLVDVAPEVEGCLDFIKSASKLTNVSIAHTNTNYQTAKEALNLGANHLTHTFNAMPGIHHRNPGPILAAAEKNAYAELICDGQHVDYAAVRLVFDMFDNTICLISDSCEATGLDDGKYSLGGQAIRKIGNKVVLDEQPDTIAASASNLFVCMKHAILDANVRPEKAIAAATINPARSIGVQDKIGSIEVGKYADFIILDTNYNLLEVYKKGKKVT